MPHLRESRALKQLSQGPIVTQLISKVVPSHVTTTWSLLSYSFLYFFHPTSTSKPILKNTHTKEEEVQEETMDRSLDEIVADSQVGSLPPSLFSEAFANASTTTHHD